MKQTFYITTTTPYVNADPHIGFALEIIQADVVARYHALCGKDIVFNTGTDEHGQKIYQGALEEGLPVQAYCDKYAERFRPLKETLNVCYTNFIRTTDDYHMKAAQHFWRLCFENGDIYKKDYQVKYCVGCELEKTDSELVDGKCPVHPNRDVELRDEENYFFRFSSYQQKLLELYDAYPDFVVPRHRLEEIKNFVAGGLQDFSISRLKAKMPWGVPVPDDVDHVMYVWFDALVNYISTLGWPDSAPLGGATPGKPSHFERFWGTKENPKGHQVAGKDNLRQQSAMWQAMLFSAGLPTSRQVFIHGFITNDGQKISKSVGNVVNPYELVKTYGTDPVRYYLSGGLPSYDDGDFGYGKLEEFYTAHLVNGVGNLTSRILTMLEKYTDGRIPNKGEEDKPLRMVFEKSWENYTLAISHYAFDHVVQIINDMVAFCDGTITEEKPWEKAKKGEDISPLLYQLAEGLRHIALALLPIIPQSAEKILNQLGIDVKTLKTLEVEKEWGRLEKGSIIKKGDILFPRLVKS